MITALAKAAAVILLAWAFLALLAVAAIVVGGVWGLVLLVIAMIGFVRWLVQP